jgi:hypothetical protein
LALGIREAIVAAGIELEEGELGRVLGRWFETATFVLARLCLGVSYPSRSTESATALAD